MPKLVKVNQLSNYLNRQIPQYLFIGIILAVIIRFICVPNKSSDFKWALTSWYNFFVEHGGFRALKYNFYDYNPPYLYWILIASSLLSWLPKILSIKLLAMFFDFICAFFTYKFVRLKYAVGQMPAKAFLVVLFTPTVIYNSSLWGQCDSIYTTFLIACLYYLCISRKSLASICFGLAISFKLQAIFFAPLLLTVFFRKYMSWPKFLLIPLVYLVGIAPAYLAGRPLIDLLSIYFNQSQKYKQLTKGAPNIYQWVPKDFYNVLLIPGLILTIVAVIMLVYFASTSKVKIEPKFLIEMALISVLLLPYIMPKIHERYFFPADIISIVFGFYFPRYFWVPIVIEIASLLSYLGTPILIKICSIPLGLTLYFLIQKFKLTLNKTEAIVVPISD